MMTDGNSANSLHQATHPRHHVSQRANNLRHSDQRRRRALLLSLIVPTVAIAACNAVPTPGRDVNQGQMMLDLNEALNSIRDQSASLQDQVDSLREVVVRQDTIIRQLALTAGIQIPVSR
jgi:hypothetical protein